MLLLTTGEVLTCGVEMYLGDAHAELGSMMSRMPRMRIMFAPVHRLSSVPIQEIIAGPQVTILILILTLTRTLPEP